MPRTKKEAVKRRKDGRWRVVYRGMEFYSRISSDDAIAQREAYKNSLKRGNNPTLAEYALPWLERSFPAVADSTYAGLAVHLQHLVDDLGRVYLSQIVPSDIKSVYSRHYSGLSNSYIKSARQLYCSLFDSAQADGLIHGNPARDKTAKPHRGSEPKTRAITEQERTWILTLCTDHRMHPAVMAMLYAGLRPPEAKALVIERDVSGDCITLHSFAHKNGQKYAYTGKGKTSKAIRTIPLFPPLKQALSGKSGYLISSAGGEPVTPTTWRVAWNSYKTCMETAINGVSKRWYGKTKEQQALAREGRLPGWIPFDIVPYDLRHSFCTMCRDAGIEINTCRRWMGHSDAKMILKVYDSVSEDRSEAERKKLEKTLFQGQTEGQPENGAPADGGK